MRLSRPEKELTILFHTNHSDASAAGGQGVKIPNRSDWSSQTRVRAVHIKPRSICLAVKVQFLVMLSSKAEIFKMKRSAQFVIFVLVIAAGSSLQDSGPNTTLSSDQNDLSSSDPDDDSTQSLGSIAPTFKPFDPTSLSPCFTSDTPENSYLLSCSALDIWGNRLLAYSRYPVAQVRQTSGMGINISAFSNAAFRNSQIVNKVNGLIGVASNNTPESPPQSICDQSTVDLLLFISNDTMSLHNFNSDLPNGFMQDVDEGHIRTTDCAKYREYGLRLMPLVDRYHGDCFGVCFNATSDLASQCGFHQKLDIPYDQILNDLSDPSSSPAINRLRKCKASGWFKSNASAAVSNVFKMCSSSASCSTLCSGDTDSMIVSARWAEYRTVSSAVTQNLASPLCSPSSILYFVKPFTIAWSKIALTAPTSGDAFQVAKYVDTMANPATGTCPGYDRAMSDFVLATGDALSPVAQYVPSSTSLAIRAIRNPACATAAIRLESLCTTKAVSPLCTRALAAQVNSSGSFQSCSDSGLSDYFPAVSDYNRRQVRAPRLPCAADVRPEEKLLSAAGRGPDLYEGLLPRPLSILVVLCGRRLGHVGSGASRPVGGERATCPLARLVRRHHGRFPLAVFYGGGDPVAPLLLLPNLHLVSQPGAPADLLHRPARLRAVHHILSDGCIFVPRGSAVAGGIRVDDGR